MSDHEWAKYPTEDAAIVSRRTDSPAMLQPRFVIGVGALSAIGSVPSREATRSETQISLPQLKEACLGQRSRD